MHRYYNIIKKNFSATNDIFASAVVARAKRLIFNEVGVYFSRVGWKSL